MSNLPALNELSKDQVALIKATVAKNATDDELKLFLYRCSQMGLDPLKPGQIYFIKYSSAPGVMVVGLDGFRAKAEASGKHTGTKRGIIRDDKGVALGAWCEVYRNDWIEPAREEVSLKEYNTGKSQWVKMPETMIKKVAEVAALRMAFPDLLGGLYSQEEMDQAEPVTKTTIKEAVLVNEPTKIEEKKNEPIVERSPEAEPKGAVEPSGQDTKRDEQAEVKIYPDKTKIKINKTQAELIYTTGYQHGFGKDDITSDIYKLTKHLKLSDMNLLEFETVLNHFKDNSKRFS